MASPTVESYLATLPDGIRSYPDALVKASVLLSGLDRLPGGPLSPIGVPEFDRFLSNPPAVNEWVPQTFHCTLLAATFDERFARGGGRTEFEEWCYARNRQLLAAPLYRVLFMVASPQRIFHGLTNRWRAFRRGMDLELTTNDAGHAIIHMRYPHFLMQELSLVAIREAVRAGLEGAGGRVTSCAVTEASPAECVFDVHYRKRTEVDDKP